MNKYRSTINPLTIIINVILYGVLLYLAYIRTPNLFVVILFIVIILIGYTSFKFVSYKYYLEDYGLLIKHKREKIIINGTLANVQSCAIAVLSISQAIILYSLKYCFTFSNIL